MAKPLKIALLIGGIFLIVGLGLTAFFRKKSLGLFGPIASHVYRERQELFRPGSLPPEVVHAAHLKDVSTVQVEALLRPNLRAAGYSKASGNDSRYMIYDHVLPGRTDVDEIEIIGGDTYKTDGVILVDYHPASKTDMFIGRVMSLGRDPCISSSDMGASPLDFLGE